VAGLDEAARKRLEVDHVERCVDYARNQLGLV
jgi:hypothetical protein